MKRILGALAALAALVVLVFHLGGGWYFAGQIRADALAVEAPAAADGSARGPEAVLGTPVRDVEYTSAVGTFPAWFVPGTGSTWAVLTHGKGADRTETLGALRTTVALDMPSLAITYRNDPGLPEDPSGFYAYGRTEWRDLEAAVQYALDHGARDVVLVGYSMGGGITAAFLESSPLAAEVSRVVLDSPMLDFGETVSFGASQRSLPGIGRLPGSLTWMAKRLATARYDVDWSETDYLDDTSWLTVPALVLHGDADLTVPLRTSEELAADREDLVDLVVVEGAAHVEVWDQDPAGYDARLRGFLS